VEEGGRGSLIWCVLFESLSSCVQWLVCSWYVQLVCSLPPTSCCVLGVGVVCS